MECSNRIPAVFMRGGTSKGIIFHRCDLPSDPKQWDRIFLSVMGSPDPYGRQLNGMGGGTSSLSKICIVGPASQDDMDVDYTFAQVSVKDARVDYGSLCGNMSSAVALFAQEEGLVVPNGSITTVRIHNTNTKKSLHAIMDTHSGQVEAERLLEIPGVVGKVAPIRLDFIEPAGATTGQLMPTGNACEKLEIPGFGIVNVSLIDAGNACVFIDAASLGLEGTELPADLALRAGFVALVEQIRRYASVAMGIASSLEAAAANPVVPFLCVVSPAANSETLTGRSIRLDEVDLTIRAFANGQPHLALPITASLCSAVAAVIGGSVVHKVVGVRTGGLLRIGMPSGILNVASDVEFRGSETLVLRASLYRTARRLFDGFVYTN